MAAAGNWPRRRPTMVVYTRTAHPGPVPNPNAWFLAPMPVAVASSATAANPRILADCWRSGDSLGIIPGGSRGCSARALLAKSSPLASSGTVILVDRPCLPVAPMRPRTTVQGYFGLTVHGSSRPLSSTTIKPVSNQNPSSAPGPSPGLLGPNAAMSSHVSSHASVP
jgi:hypothetical protein